MADERIVALEVRVDEHDKRIGVMEHLLNDAKPALALLDDIRVNTERIGAALEWAQRKRTLAFATATLFVLHNQHAILAFLGKFW